MPRAIALINPDIAAGVLEDLLCRDFCGCPLIHWQLLALQQCPEVERILVFTQNILLASLLGESKTFDKLLLLPGSAPISGGDVLSVELMHYLKDNSYANVDLLIVSNGINPFLTAEQFTEAIEQLWHSTANSLVSVVRQRAKTWMVNGGPDNEISHIPSSGSDQVFLENGAFSIRWITEAVPSDHNPILFEMPFYSAHQLLESPDWAIGVLLMQHYHPALGPQTNYRKIRLMVSDVDGVLTDGSMYYTEQGDEIKRFHTYDGMAFGLLRELGIKTALITSEDTQMVSNRAKKLRIDYLYQGRKHGGKLAAIEDICRQEQLQLHEVAYVGDDINCREALSAVGFAFCPANALPDIKALPRVIQLERRGGEGAIREVYEKYIRPAYGV